MMGPVTSRAPRWHGFRHRLARNLAWAAVIYPTLFILTFALAVAACYVWPWLLDPVSP